MVKPEGYLKIIKSKLRRLKTIISDNQNELRMDINSDESMVSFLNETLFKIKASKMNLENRIFMNNLKISQQMNKDKGNYREINSTFTPYYIKSPILSHRGVKISSEIQSYLSKEKSPNKRKVTKIPPLLTKVGRRKSSLRKKKSEKLIKLNNSNLEDKVSGRVSNILNSQETLRERRMRNKIKKGNVNMRYSVRDNFNKANRTKVNLKNKTLLGSFEKSDPSNIKSSSIIYSTERRVSHSNIYLLIILIRSLVIFEILS